MHAVDVQLAGRVHGFLWSKHKIYQTKMFGTVGSYRDEEAPIFRVLFAIHVGYLQDSLNRGGRPYYRTPFGIYTGRSLQ